MGIKNVLPYTKQRYKEINSKMYYGIFYLTKLE